MPRARQHDYTGPAPGLVPCTSIKFNCPGCHSEHAVWVKGDPKDFPIWQWNGSLDRPTFSPSVLRQGPQRDSAGNYTCGSEGVCHSFITDGRIQFLDDCTHHLKGQTVDLPELVDTVA